MVLFCSPKGESHLRPIRVSFERGVQVTTSSGRVSTDIDLQDAASFNKEDAKIRNLHANRKPWDF